MRGVFRPRYLLWLWFPFFISAGFLIAVRFGTWGIDAVRAGQVASAVFCLLFSVFGLAFGCLWIVIFNFNRAAFLEVDETILRAAFGWEEKLEVSISDIVDADARGKDLVLWIGKDAPKGYVIHGLENAVEIGVYIRGRIPGVIWLKDLTEERKKLRTETKKYRIFLCALVACLVAMFANIGLCVWLTDGKDLSAFTRHDDIVFAASAFAEVVLIIAGFLFASRCGVARKNKDHHAFTLIACEAYVNRKTGLEKYADIDSVWYFDSSTRRIVIFRSDDGYGYMLENYVSGNEWTAAYPVPYAFKTYGELQKDISFRFSDVILESLP